MADDLSTPIEKHIEWTEYINQRLEVIYKEICEYEKIINLQNEENQPFSLLELLQRINELHDAAKHCSPVTAELKSKALDINQQIEGLQNTMELLKLGKQQQEDTEPMAD